MSCEYGFHWPLACEDYKCVERRGPGEFTEISQNDRPSARPESVSAVDPRHDPEVSPPHRSKVLEIDLTESDAPTAKAP